MITDSQPLENLIHCAFNKTLLKAEISLAAHSGKVGLRRLNSVSNVFAAQANRVAHGCLFVVVDASDESWAG